MRRWTRGSGSRAATVAWGAFGGLLLGLFVGVRLGRAVEWLLPASAAAGLAAGVAAGVVAWSRQVRERRFWEGYARQRGWTYAHADVEAGARLGRFLPYATGHAPWAEHTLRGDAGGMAFSLHEGQYSVGHARHERTRIVHTVVAGMPFPLDLRVEPERARHRVADAVTGQDIDFEHDRFSRRFRVRGADRRAAYAVLHPQAIEHLMRLGGGWTHHWDGRNLAVSRKGRLTPARAAHLVAAAQAFRALLPRHMLADAGALARGAGPPAPSAARPPAPAPGQRRP